MMLGCPQETCCDQQGKAAMQVTVAVVVIIILSVAACATPTPTPTPQPTTHVTPPAPPPTPTSAASPTSTPTPTATPPQRRPRPTVRTLEELKKDISPERPLVTVFETFQRGGHRRGYENYGPGEIGDYIVVWPEWVIDKTVITPDSDGLAVSMTRETWSADGTPPVVRSLFDDSVVTGLPDPDPVYTLLLAAVLSPTERR